MRMTDLDHSLRQFDRVEANLERVEQVVRELQDRIPDGVSFEGASPAGLEYQELIRQFHDLASGLPPINGFVVEAHPPDLNEIAQNRLDAIEISEPQLSLELQERIDEPAIKVADYRHRFTRARRQLVRRRVQELIETVDCLLAPLGLPPDIAGTSEDLGGWAHGFAWDELRDHIAEIQRLLKGRPLSGARWGELNRHASFAEPIDLRDIVMFDWPSVRTDVDSQLYSEREPLPVDIGDLADVAKSEPQGGVTTALDWKAMDAEGFERLVFNLVGQAPGYENPQWLTKTNAPDRGRDLSVDRVISDPLGGTRRSRVMIQCRHRPDDSVTPADSNDVLVKAKLWDNPPFDAVIIATTSRFTTDAVDWIETSNTKERIQIEMWPESHLEMLLAARPALIEEFGLRG